MKSVIKETSPPKKGGNNNLGPRDWAGNEQEKSQLSFDPDDNDFDVDFDQVFALFTPCPILPDKNLLSI